MPSWSESSIPPMPASGDCRRSSARSRTSSCISNGVRRPTRRRPKLRCQPWSGRSPAKSHPSGRPSRRPRTCSNCATARSDTSSTGWPRSSATSAAGQSLRSTAPARRLYLRRRPCPRRRRFPVLRRVRLVRRLPPRLRYLSRRRPPSLSLRRPGRVHPRRRAPSDCSRAAAGSSAGARLQLRPQSKSGNAGRSRRRLRGHARRAQATGHAHPGRQIGFHRRSAPRRAGKPGGSRQDPSRRARARLPLLPTSSPGGSAGCARSSGVRPSSSWC